eukprot:TRINITY_DN2079_c0_g2_i2.p1 TRINITY_DN2079_c0_g2~~TRINITY_DN2079_c0_g2_i2.p1  ORF type:complete len:234 (+),score=32.11 TRINITY_DN2079_c0_g2_i2:121-822(+)
MQAVTCFVAPVPFPFVKGRTLVRQQPRRGSPVHLVASRCWSPRMALARSSVTDEAGCDTLGNQYENAEDMWRKEAGEGLLGEDESSKKHVWYQSGIKYWEGVEASVDGVLGGYADVDEDDVKESGAFLREVLGRRLAAASTEGDTLVALDCGAGVGRVTNHLLLHFFNEVDLVEPVEKFLAVAEATLKEKRTDQRGSVNGHAVNFICRPLEVWRSLQLLCATMSSGCNGALAT